MPMGLGKVDPATITKNLEQLSSMDDGQMEQMLNMMKMNPSMMKANYEAQTG